MGAPLPMGASAHQLYSFMSVMARGRKTWRFIRIFTGHTHEMKEKKCCTSCGEFKGTLVEKNKNAGTTVYSPVELYTNNFCLHFLYVCTQINTSVLTISLSFPSLSFFYAHFVSPVSSSEDSKSE